MLATAPMPPTPNTITAQASDFYVSFNTRDHAIYGCATTALVWGQMQRFYILNGDHRAAYSKLVDRGWDACLAYFSENAADMNKLSDSLPHQIGSAA